MVSHRPHAVRRLAWALALALPLGAVATPAASATELVDFTGNSNLESCVKLALFNAGTAGASDPVTTDTIATLTQLACSTSVGSLAPLAHATAVESLTFTNGGTFDLNHLTGLANLRTLNLNGGVLTIPADAGGLAAVTTASLKPVTVVSGDPGALTGLTRLGVNDAFGSLGFLDDLDALTALTLQGNYVDGGFADWSPVASVTTLEELTITSSTFSDLSLLAGASDLRVLVVPHSAVSDLGPLASHAALRELDIQGTAALDLAPLSGLTDLEVLNARYVYHYSTLLADISPLATLVNLTSLDLEQNAITDLTPLAGMTALERLDLHDNDIVSVAPLAGLSSLTWLDLEGNSIADPTPLLGLGVDKFRLRSNAIVDGSALAPLVDGFVTADAWDQYIPLGTVGLCRTTDVAVPTGVLGSTLPLQVMPARGTISGGTITWTQTGYAAIQWQDPDVYGDAAPVHYSGKYAVTVDDCIVNTSAPAVVGPASVGQTVTADPGTWGSLGATYEYQWLRNGDPIDGANANTYVIASADAGTSLSVRVTADAPGVTWDTATSEAVAVPAVVDGATATIGGVPAVGRLQSASTDGFPDGTKFTYAWTRDGVPIGGATGATYKPTRADRGKQLGVTVTGTATGYEPAVAYAPTVTILKALSPSTPRIKGSPNVGSTLTAKPGVWEPTGVTKSYQWYRDGVAIEGATDPRYAVTVSDAGRDLTVTVAGTKSGYATESRTSAAKPINAIFPSTPTPTVSGGVDVGATLTATPGVWEGGPTLAYRWLRDGAPISGATGASYVVKTADAGRSISVRVTASAPGYTTAPATSAPTHINGWLAKAPTPEVIGTIKPGRQLRADVGGWGPGDVALQLTWLRDGAPISGATGTTYVVDPWDYGHRISVAVTGTRSGYTDRTKTAQSRAVRGIVYDNCDDMRVHYPDGVARSADTVDMVSGVPAGSITDATFVSFSLWKLNPKRDADQDGWACEP